MLDEQTVRDVEEELRRTNGGAEPAWRALRARGSGASRRDVRAVRKDMMGRGELLPKVNSRESPTVADPESPIFRGDLVRKLLRRWRVVDSLAEDLHVTAGDVVRTIRHLEERGYQVLWDGARVRIVREASRGGRTDLKDGSPIVNGWRRFGVLADTHLASRWERLDVLEAAYDRYAELGITDVYHGGNVVDGESKHNQFDLKAHGVADQALYVLDNYPQRSGITTHYIGTECHEGWWRKDTGLDFGRYLQFEARDRGRNDLDYLGFLEADVWFAGPKAGGSWLRLFHPGGGSSYAFSYQHQKIVESLSGGEKPAMLLVAHFHKALYLVVRNVHVISCGCCQDQSTFMRKRRISAHVGYWVVETQQDRRGAIRRVRTEWTGFFDRSYHKTVAEGN